MGLASLAADAVPTKAFTPHDPLVELLRVALSKDVIFIMSNPGNKTFIYSWLIKEWCWSVRHNCGSILLSVKKEIQAQLWRSLLERMLDVKPYSVTNVQDPSSLIVDTHEEVEKFLRSSDKKEMKISLFIIDNGHTLMESNIGTSMMTHIEQFRLPASRLVISTAEILKGVKDKSLKFLCRQIQRMESFFKCQVEASCERLSILRFISMAKVAIVQYLTSHTPIELEFRIVATVNRLLNFLENHKCDYRTMYEDTYPEMFTNYTEPTDTPRKILEDFLYVVRSMGLWAADRATLILLFLIRRLEENEKHERHFILLGVLNTEMVKIRRYCELAFGDLSEKEKIQTLSKPKVLKLIEILRKYKPEHIGRNKRQPTPEGDTTGAYHPSPIVRRSRGQFTSYDDPNALCGVIYVRNKFASKIMFHLIKDLSRSEDTFSFLMPQYATTFDEEGLENPVEDESERKKQEDSLRRFRMRECNILVSSSLLEFGVENVRCNLVVALDPPKDFASYLQLKVKTKSQKSALLIILSDEESTRDLSLQLSLYQVTEERLKNKCAFPGVKAEEVFEADNREQLIAPFNPLADNSTGIHGRCNIATSKASIFYVNRYCAKLPSDTFTRLIPLYQVIRTESGGFTCNVELPINSPCKHSVQGPEMPTIELSKRAAALEACRVLHVAKEIDDYMVPVGKDGLRTWVRNKINRKSFSPSPQEESPLKKVSEEEVADVKPQVDVIRSNVGETSVPEIVTKQVSPKQFDVFRQRVGTTKRRQFYSKHISKFLKAESERFYLYAIVHKLTCPLPDDQNVRGRPIFDPTLSNQSFGLLVGAALPPMCEFPIYTRSGEVFIEILLIDDNVQVNKEQKDHLLTFHNYTFSTVLRLEKLPVVFSPSESENKTIIVPLRNKMMIDWSFVDSIHHQREMMLRPISEDERKDYAFDPSKFEDAVVIPWYRNQDHPVYFYVAEICSHLTPKSRFPGESFATFEDYYRDKYKINIKNLDQPLLDVDHSSSRLNFLTPRYVNRKGIALPSSSEETKKNKRENLEQKQILVPELCLIHPFSASLWKHAVCLPCILYRMNALLISEEIRSTVFREISFGREVLDTSFKWPPMTFGWTLSEVLKKRPLTNDRQVPKPLPLTPKIDSTLTSNNNSTFQPISNWKESDTNDELDLSRQLITLMKQDQTTRTSEPMEIGTWSNEMLVDICDQPTPDDSDEDDEENMDEFLPFNVGFIDKNTLSTSAANTPGCSDWGTGIPQKVCRVGSPTSFSNPNINIPGNTDDWDEYFSGASNDEEEENFRKVLKSKSRRNKDFVDEEIFEVGGVRISFLTTNTAEAIEDEAERNKRIESLERDKADEEEMLRDIEWTWKEEECPLSEEFEADVKRTHKLFEQSENFITPPEGEFSRTSLNLDLSMISQSSISQDARLSASDPLIHLRHSSQQIPNLPKIDFNNIPTGIMQRDDDPELEFSFDEQPDLNHFNGPAPSLLLQALTMSNSNDAINLERLETIGDSFLKYAITSFLYCANESVHEGRLSHLRSKQVSNHNLYRLGRSKGLGHFMVASKFEPHDNWLPPCFYLPQEPDHKSSHPTIQNQETEELLDEQKQITKSDSDDPPVENHANNLCIQHTIPDKSIADCVEALIGAYLISGGQQGALMFMTWLGLTVLPDPTEGTHLIDCRLPKPKSPLLHHDSMPLVETLLDGFTEFESLIGYKFKDRSYLLQAFTHASYYPNRFTDCYQRLEFLGDAVLDYLITRQLFEDPRLHSPGSLTDLRSALVNNTIFASLAVKFNFHKYFKFFAPSLQTVINRFVKLQADCGYAVIDDFYLFDDDDSEEAEDVEVPKSLGDIFESVAGAIFLDSELSLDAVWKVYYRMMKPEIDKYSENVPKSPIRELLELEPETAKFLKPEKLLDGRRVRVTVEVYGKGAFKGIGRNYRIAKCTAAKCALRAIKKKK